MMMMLMMMMMRRFCWAFNGKGEAIWCQRRRRFSLEREKERERRERERERAPHIIKTTITNAPMENKHLLCAKPNNSCPKGSLFFVNIVSNKASQTRWP
jgi:hypothetical protein